MRGIKGHETAAGQGAFALRPYFIRTRTFSPPFRLLSIHKGQYLLCHIKNSAVMKTTWNKENCSTAGKEWSEACNTSCEECNTRKGRIKRARQYPKHLSEKNNTSPGQRKGRRTGCMGSKKWTPAEHQGNRNKTRKIIPQQQRKSIKTLAENGRHETEKRRGETRPPP